MGGIEFATHAMRWVFTGDSVTHGAAHTFGERDYVQLFEERLRWELGRRRDHVIRTAVSGRTVADLAADLDWSVLQYRPDVVSIMLGLNDSQSAGVGPEEFVETCGRVIRRLTETGAAIILHTPNRVRSAESGEYPQLAWFAEAIRALARSNGCLLVDHFRAWERPEGSGATAAWLGQTCHPNAYGHRALATLLLARLGIWDADSPTAQLAFFPNAVELELEQFS